MKKLFLASVAAYTIDKFIAFLDIDPKKSTIAFIPTASNLENWEPTEDRDKLVQLGFKIKDIDISNKTKKDLYQEMKDIDLIFVAGGNTFYLLKEARKSQFDEIIIELTNKGIPYIGSSAGSILVGPSIEIALNIDNQLAAKELKNFEGIGLVNFIVLPHWDDDRFRPLIEQNLEKSLNRGFETIKLIDQQAVLVDGDKISIIKS